MSCIELFYSLLFMALQSNCGPELMNLSPPTALFILCLSFRFLSCPLSLVTAMILSYIVINSGWDTSSVLHREAGPCNFLHSLQLIVTLWLIRNLPEQSPASAARLMGESEMWILQEWGRGEIHLAKLGVTDVVTIVLCLNYCRPGRHKKYLTWGWEKC